MTNPEGKDIDELSKRNDNLYTPSEIMARNIISFGAILKYDANPREAGDIVIKLAKQIKKERPKR